MRGAWVCGDEEAVGHVALDGKRLRGSAPGGHDGSAGMHLVSRRSDYDGLIQSENGQFLWWQAQLDAAGYAGQFFDQAQLVEGLEHLVD